MNNAVKSWQLILFVLSVLLLQPQIATAGFEESFNDANFSSRGWYDNTNPILSASETYTGSARSVEFRFRVGATTPVNGRAMRRKIPETDSIYVRYYVKYSTNWQGSNRNYHPHEFYVLTNRDTDWTGPAYTHLTAYIEQLGLRPQLAIQDGRNIDLNNLNRNLVGATENRSVAGCNGDSDGYGNGSCYHVGGGIYHNDKSWVTGNPHISRGKWHKVEAYFKLNSISNGKGVPDGVMQYWLDDELIINYSNIVMRTARHPDMKFNQFIIGPWIGDGSPIDQTFWVDNLLVARERPKQTEPVIDPPTNLRIAVGQ